jgi:hypothetical protein
MMAIFSTRCRSILIDENSASASEIPPGGNSQITIEVVFGRLFEKDCGQREMNFDDNWQLD